MNFDPQRAQRLIRQFAEAMERIGRLGAPSRCSSAPVGYACRCAG